MSPAAALFHSLSDETRLVIVQRLARGEMRVADLVTRAHPLQNQILDLLGVPTTAYLAN